MIKIYDVSFGKVFWSDWSSAPPNIQKRFNEDIGKIVDAKQLLPSINAHKIKNHEDGWYIGYISVGVFAWRFLFSVSSSGTMVVERILSHNLMDKLLRK
jgi:hypothetical protein